jgi:RHS repeat-associated protein
MTDESGSFNYSYDAFGRLVSQTRVVDSVSFTTGYTYDNAGNLRSITYPTGQTIAYQADMTDPALIAAVALNPSGANQTLASGITYQPFGPLNSLTYGNATVLTKTFDPNYQIATLAVDGIISRNYTPDNVGNITAIDDLIDPTRSQSFIYDDLYRLTDAAGIYGAIAYTYDNVGNRQTRTDTSGTDTYTYLAGTNKLRTVSGPNAKSYSYDTDGNVIAALGGQQPPLTDQAEYTYGSSGQRSKKTVDTAQTVISHFDQSGQLIAETTAAGAMIKAYVWLHGQPLAQISPDGSIYYYHIDHLGTPQRLTDASGTIVWAADYLPFGKADVTIGTVENNLRFAGQYYDQETGLHYNYWRYYDPSLGRYLRADPSHLKQAKEIAIPYLIHSVLRTPQDLHAYVFVSNNPVNYQDQFGLDRYNPCQNLPWLAKKVCRKYVDWGCSGTRNVACCEAEKTECTGNIECDDPEYEKKMADCFAEYVKCISKTK